MCSLTHKLSYKKKRNKEQLKEHQDHKDPHIVIIIDDQIVNSLRLCRAIANKVLGWIVNDLHINDR